MRYNNEFKKIDNEYKAYLLGFFYGDGSISQYKENNKMRYQSRISISIKDSNVLDMLMHQFPFFNSSIFDYSKYNQNSNKQKYITNRSKKMYDDLKFWGVLPRKSYENKENLKIPNINGNLLNHFIRGFFDADGTVYRMKYRKNLIRVEIVCNSFNFINQLNRILNQNDIETLNLITRTPVKQNESKYFIITISKQREIEKFKNYIYLNSTIYLERKHKLLCDHKIVNKVIDRNIKCDYCGSLKVVKNGKRNNKFRLKCYNCNKHFTKDYL